MWALFTFIFLLIFGPVVRSPLGSFGDLSILTALTFLIWSLWVGCHVTKNIKLLCWIAFILTALAFLNSVLISENIELKHLQVIIRPLKGLLIFLGVYFAIIRLLEPYIEEMGPRKAYESLLTAVYVAVIVHGFIIICQFIFPAFRDLTYAILIDSNVLDFNKQLRMPGLAGAGGAQVSAVQGLGFFVGVHLALIKKRYLPFIFGNLIIVVSLVLTGRTGFVLVGISFLYWVTFVVFKKRSLSSTIKVRSLLVRILIGVILLLFISKGVSFFTSYSYDDPMLKVAIERTFETYLNYSETGELSDTTLTALSEMYEFPEKPSTLIFGDVVKYDNAASDYNSDIGYVRLVWGYGLIGLAGHILFYLLMGYLILSSSVRRIMGAENIALGLWVLGSVFVLNYKEPFFFSRMSYQITLFVIIGLYYLGSSHFKVNFQGSRRFNSFIIF